MLEIIVASVVIFIIWVVVAGIISGKKAEEARQKAAKERTRQLKQKYHDETPARRALIIQLYHERLDLKEITFILRKGDYRSITGEEITMKEIMDEHAQIQLDKHKEEERKGQENE